MISGTLTEIVLPHAARKDPVGARRVAVGVLAVHGGLFIVCAACAAFATPLVTVVFGAEYSPAAPTLAASLLSMPVASLSSPLGSVLQGQGAERFVAANGVVFAVALVVSMTLGGLLYGGVGIAASIGIVFGVKDASLLAKIRRLK
jgi:O-antigen/teichoic acid export membrane protein